MLGVPTVAARPIRPIREKDLQRWRLIERFQSALATEAEPRGGLNGTWGDPERQLKLEQYLSLFLFGLFNPVVESMRGLCEASKLERVQREVCGRRVNLGSFSEAQAVVDPALLKAVLQRLVSEADTPEWPRAAPGKSASSTARYGRCCRGWLGRSGGGRADWTTRCGCTWPSTWRPARSATRN